MSRHCSRLCLLNDLGYDLKVMGLESPAGSLPAVPCALFGARFPAGATAGTAFLILRAIR